MGWNRSLATLLLEELAEDLSWTTGEIELTSARVRAGTYEDITPMPSED